MDIINIATVFATIIGMLGNTRDSPFSFPTNHNFLVSKFTFRNMQDKTTFLPLTFKDTPNTSRYKPLTTGS